MKGVLLMKEYRHETIIIDRKGWEFLRNTNRTLQGFKALSQEQLDKVWNSNRYRNNGANPKTHPIAENEIRICPDSFSIKWDKVKKLLNDNGFKQRQDGYEIDGIYL
jgi:hypothetical protein